MQFKKSRLIGILMGIICLFCDFAIFLSEKTSKMLPMIRFIKKQNTCQSNTTQSLVFEKSQVIMVIMTIMLAITFLMHCLVTFYMIWINKYEKEVRNRRVKFCYICTAIAILSLGSILGNAIKLMNCANTSSECLGKYSQQISYVTRIQIIICSIDIAITLAIMILSLLMKIECNEKKINKKLEISDNSVNSMDTFLKDQSTQYQQPMIGRKRKKIFRKKQKEDPQSIIYDNKIVNLGKYQAPEESFWDIINRKKQEIKQWIKYQ